MNALDSLSQVMGEFKISLKFTSIWVRLKGLGHAILGNFSTDQMVVPSVGSNVGPPFVKFISLISVCIKMSFTQLENHSVIMWL